MTLDPKAALARIKELLSTAFGAGVYDIGPPAPGMEGSRSHSQSGYAQAILEISESALASAGAGDGWRAIETVYVVGGTVGEWSDRSEWTIGVWVSEADAEAFVEKIDALGREYEQAVSFRNDEWNDETDAAVERAEAACRAVEKGWSSYCGDAPRYTCWPEKLILPASPLNEEPTRASPSGEVKLP